MNALRKWTALDAGLAWRIGCCALLFAAFAGCPALGPTYPVGVIKDVVYGTGYVTDGQDPPVVSMKDLLLDVYYPEGAPETMKTAIVLIHGGSFEGGSKEKVQVVDHARYYASHGFVAFSIEYRLSDDHPPAPEEWDVGDIPRAAHAASVDAKAAVRWVRANSAAYGIDPDSIVVWGESAGAVAALTVAVTDPEDYATDGPDYPMPEGNYPEESSKVQGCIELWGGAFLILTEFDTGDPPIMIVHGTEDNTFYVSYFDAKLIHAAVEALGIPHEFYAIDGAGHGPWNARVDGKNLKRLSLDFLYEHVL